MRIVLVICVVFLFFGCSEPNPEGAVFISELDVWVDEDEVTVLEFMNHVNENDVAIRTDSVKQSSIFSFDSLKWVMSINADYSSSNGIDLSDSLHPVTQLSWEDACAFCRAKGGRLPEAEEWEVFSSGDYVPGNIWEGYFPIKDEGLDGYTSISEIRKFKPNSFGLYDVYGNVREWVMNKDSLGNSGVKGGSFLTDYNSGKFLEEYLEFISSESTVQDIGFRCVYPRN